MSLESPKNSSFHWGNLRSMCCCWCRYTQLHRQDDLIGSLSHNWDVPPQANQCFQSSRMLLCDLFTCCSDLSNDLHSLHVLNSYISHVRTVYMAGDSKSCSRIEFMGFAAEKHEVRSFCHSSEQFLRVRHQKVPHSLVTHSHMEVSAEIKSLVAGLHTRSDTDLCIIQGLCLPFERWFNTVHNTTVA